MWWFLALAFLLCFFLVVDIIIKTPDVQVK